MLITDTQNNVVGLNLFRDYGAWMVNRGQEADRCWMDDSVKLEFAVPPHLIRYKAEVWHQVLVNRAHRKEETDWFAPGTYSLALKWLEQNHRRKDFFLWIDTFDPHEPWDPPKHYLDRYDPGYEGRVFEAPTYGVRKQMRITDRELQHIRARYAAEVTMVGAASRGQALPQGDEALRAERIVAHAQQQLVQQVVEPVHHRRGAHQQDRAPDQPGRCVPVPAGGGIPEAV
jgi:hypothetical protein